MHALKLQVGMSHPPWKSAPTLLDVATDSADRAVTVNTTQIEDTPSRGRGLSRHHALASGNSAGYQQRLPGIVSQTATAVNGGQQGQVLVSLDGAASQDSTAPGTGGYATPSVDAIGEVKVLVGNYTAEYGARNGGLVTVSTKSGTSQFHGTADYYFRNEELNANEWFNDAQRLAKPRYRYGNAGVTLGGPFLIPRAKFNRSRTKLFFFFSEDYLHNQSAGAPNQFTMPSAAERSGDFTQTVTSKGVLIPIIDPTSGKPFPGNVIPANRISPQGYALLNLFPLPFTTDPSGQRQYNAIYQWTTNNPREDKILRVDYNLSPKTSMYARLIQDYAGNEGNGTTAGPTGSGWGQLPAYFDAPSVGASATVVHTFRPDLINEATWGVNRGSETAGALNPAQYAAQVIASLRDPSGQPVSLPQVIPGANPTGLLPKISFGTNSPQSPGQAVTNAPAFGWGIFWPFNGSDTLNTFTDSVTWVKQRHTLKAGFYFEHDNRPFAQDGDYMAQYWFGSDTASPVDTGYAYSNALLGSIQSQEQDSPRQFTYTHYYQFEWFAQDTWKVNRRVTVDYGLRFQMPGPSDDLGQTMGVFNPSGYSASTSGQLLYPALVNGQKVALNPITQVTYPAARINSFDPASYANGNPYSGISEYKSDFFKWPGIGVGPRFGLAWDVFGNGKTAVRGGFGVTYGRAYNPNLAQTLQQVPPGYQKLTFYNTTFSTLLATQATLSPIAAPTGSPNYKNPSTNNWSIGIQQNLGKGFIADVAYVGNVAHHQFGTNLVDINAVKPYTTWNPATGVNPKYQDPTNATGGLYNVNLIRALSGGYVGYGALNEFTSKGESNYNSLQVQINKRFGKQFQMGSNYTWSKTIVFSPQQFLPDELTKNVINRPQAVNVNFGYELPKVSSLWKNFLTTEFLDGWRLNGVGSYYSGTPMTIGCSATNVPANLGNYWTGTPASGVAIPFRCQMNGNLWLPPGATPASDGSTVNARLWYPFNAGQALSTGPGFVLPSATSLGIGNTPPTLTYGPGLESWDLSLSKQFPLGKETRVLELRIETFNTFNHFNPSNPNTSLTYNFVTGAQTNANFGAITSAQNQARHGALSLRLRF